MAGQMIAGRVLLCAIGLFGVGTVRADEPGGDSRGGPAPQVAHRIGADCVAEMTAVIPMPVAMERHDGVFQITAATVSFMQDILNEVIGLFPSRFIHIGGDEANLRLWTDDPEMQAIARIWLAAQPPCEGYPLIS